MHIRVGDEVEVISGVDGGTRGRVKSIDREANRVVVEGVNLVYKHVRPTQRNPRGGRLSKEMWVDISKVLLVCTACQKASRTGARFKDDGSKERFCKKCGAGQGMISPAKAKYAKAAAAPQQG